jgi:TolB-like protein/DNA-binding winged helix-turn-helix (wHTH) protein
MPFIFAGHELDLRRQELRRGGQTVHVEPQVFDLLVLLLKNRDRIVTKDEILDTIWDGRIVSEAALSSRINAARKAIGDNGDNQSCIRTFHKRGFRFVAEVQEVFDQPQTSAPPMDRLANETVVDVDHMPASAEQLRTSTVADPAISRARTFIAVLPFANLSQNPEHEYFAYGLTEDIIRLLGRKRWLNVLSRHSTYPFAGRDLDHPEFRSALGVDYLVRGSVQRSGDRLRIAAELDATEDGRQLWSEVYDLVLPDIFDIQEAIAEQIAAFIEPELASVEQQLAVRKPPENLDAWDCYQRGLWHLWGFTTPGFKSAEELFQRAIQIEPSLARAHAALSYVYLQRAFYGDPKDRPALLQAALTAGRRAVALDDRDCLCHCVFGRAHCLLKNYDEAITELKLTIELNPSFAQGYFALGFAMVWSGNEEEAIPLLERATELSPRDPHLWTFHHLRAMAHFSLGELDSAEQFTRNAVRQTNVTYWPFATLVAVLGVSGRADEAREALKMLFERKPEYTVSFAREDLFFCADQRFADRYLEGLRRAGVPE